MGENLQKTLRSRYLSAFFAILFLSATTQVLIQYFIHRQKNDGLVVNVAGRQRMLSQRLAKLGLLIEEKPNFKLQFESTFAELKTNHLKLQYGSPKDEFPEPFDEEIGEEYERLRPVVLKLRSAVDCIMASCLAIDDASKTIQIETESFLIQMDHIVQLTSEVSKARTIQLSVIEIIIFILIVSLLFYEWRRIVKPFQKELEQQSSGLASKETYIDQMGKVGKIGYWELDIVTGESHWSPEVYEIHQIAQGTATNLIDGLSYYAEHERIRLQGLLRKCQEEKISIGDEFEFYDHKGVHKWVRVHAEPLLSKDGKVEKLVGVFQDVTKRKKSELEVESAKRYLELAVDGANLGIWDWNLVDNSVQFDRRWAAIVGLDYNKIEMKLETWESLVHPDDIKKCYSDIKAYMDGKTSYYENVHRMKHADGHWVYILDRGKFSDWDRDGKPIRFTGTHFDITESQKLQEEQKLILSSVNVGIWKWDIKNNVLVWDGSMYELFGVDPNEFKGAYEAWESVLHPDHKDQAVNDLNEALAGRKEFDTSFAIVDKEGKTRHIGGRGRIEWDENRKPVYMYGINWDITEKKMYERQMEHNSKLASIGQLAAGVGHEINNPLTIISGYLGFLKEEDLSKKTKMSRVELVERMQKAVDRIANIVKGLRTFARQNESEDLEKFDLVELVYESTDMIKEIFQKEGVKVEFTNHCGDDPVFVIANRGRLQQILVNLISNAKDASDGKSNRRINVTLTKSHETVAIEVEDNGKGISEEDQKRIFDPFFTTKPVGKGTGLGLSIVHKLVKEMEGDISVNSAQGVGTCFKIQLPLRADFQIDSEATEEIRVPEKSKGHLSLVKNEDAAGRILVVDDEKEIRLLLRDILKEMNLSVSTAKNGPDALEKFKENPFKYDIVISDFKMPEMDGLQLIDAMRKVAEGNPPKFILLTGGTSDEFENLDGIIDGFLLKPYQASEIESLVNQLLVSKKRRKTA